MTTYTNIAKPSNTTYTVSNTIGKQQYDQSDISYDDSSVFYDGVNVAEYTSIAKPSSTVYTNIAKPT